MRPSTHLPSISLTFYASLLLILSPALSNLEPGGFILQHSNDYSHLFLPRLLILLSAGLFLPKLIHSRHLPLILLAISSLFFLLLFGFSSSTAYSLIKVCLVFYSAFSHNLSSLRRLFFLSLSITLLLGLFIYLVDGCSLATCPRFYFFYTTNNLLPFRLAASFAEPAPFAALLLILLALYLIVPPFPKLKIAFLLLLIILSGSTLLLLSALCLLAFKIARAFHRLEIPLPVLLLIAPLSTLVLFNAKRYSGSFIARLELLPNLDSINSLTSSFHIFGPSSLTPDFVIPGVFLIGLRLGIIPLILILLVTSYSSLSLFRHSRLSASPIFFSLILWFLYSEAPFDPLLLYPVALSLRLHTLSSQSPELI